jgi:hypothetical protein
MTNGTSTHGSRSCRGRNRRYESRPSWSALAAAALRFGAPSLASTAETWWSTVLTEMDSFAAIAALVCPAQSSARTSRSRRVRQGAEEVVPAGPSGAQLQQLAAQLVGEVVQRPERARGEQAVARAPGPARITQLPLEPFEQGGLADTRLPAEDDQAAVAPPGLGRTVGQQGQ